MRLPAHSAIFTPGEQRQSGLFLAWRTPAAKPPRTSSRFICARRQAYRRWQVLPIRVGCATQRRRAGCTASGADGWLPLWQLRAGAQGLIPSERTADPSTAIGSGETSTHRRADAQRCRAGVDRPLGPWPRSGGRPITPRSSHRRRPRAFHHCSTRAPGPACARCSAMTLFASIERTVRGAPSSSAGEMGQVRPALSGAPPQGHFSNARLIRAASVLDALGSGG
ncbi:hypothetical protein DSL92_01335 [Billgrantia gudaonensis]|uniref:Uncharacterized protein n=1 Tax=Billgrantia gudaonensis TaxID=376427 RepID=A0A3S0QGA2_9GAMM|nr:hypothetical protein DSL92_01335 [Halomonas gudaonensis]